MRLTKKNEKKMGCEKKIGWKRHALNQNKWDVRKKWVEKDLP